MKTSYPSRIFDGMSFTILLVCILLNWADLLKLLFKLLLIYIWVNYYTIILTPWIYSGMLQTIGSTNGKCWIIASYGLCYWSKKFVFFNVWEYWVGDDEINIIVSIIFYNGSPIDPIIFPIWKNSSKYF